jgi:hypothetical protein
MQYDKRIVCYFDILGFAETVYNKALGAEIISQLLSEVKEIIADYKKDHILISHFSDSFVISITHRSTTPTQLRFVIDVILKLLEYNLIVRGAIVYGEIIHTEENIFGPALVKAACIEKTKAKFPRVLLDESLDELPLPTIGNSPINYRAYFNDFKFVKTDSQDNEFYVDFITEINTRENSSKLTKNIETLINTGIQNPNPKISCKYHWLKEKYENYLNIYPN